MASFTPRRRLSALTALTALTLVVAGCGGGSSNGGGAGTSASSGTSTASGTAGAQRGGTLKLVGLSDVDHLDTSSIYSGVTYTVSRAFTRQLVTYPATGTTSMPTKIVADIASAVPSAANGGVTDHGLIYTYHIKPGVDWDTSPARQVTAADEVRGIKLLCNPASPTGAPGYYESTIKGLTAYCNAFTKVPAKVGAIRSFVNSHNIAGVVATNRLTVTFHLTQPASDFNNIMSLAFSSPQPAENLNYVPDSAPFRQHTIADGPYKISKYVANQSIVLTRNPAWKASTDTVRPAYVNEIDITEGVQANTVQQELQVGTADMEWDEDVPTQSLPSLVSTHNPHLDIYSSDSLDPYLVINFQSPNENHATSKLDVRRALEYAVDKPAIEQVNGGPALNKPLNQIITPGSAGYQQFNLYSTPNDSGDPAKAKSLLAAAGYPHGINLKLIYDNDDPDPASAQTLQADLAKAGFHLQLAQVPESTLYGQYLAQPSIARRGGYDLALADWGPDWFGNNGRTTVQPLLDGASYTAGSSDYGDYDSAAENALIKKALAAPSESGAATYWNKADRQAMSDAALVPLEVHEHASFSSSAVHNFRIDPYSRVGDVTSVWLSPG